VCLCECDLVAQIPNTMEVSFLFFFFLYFYSSCLFYILHSVSSWDMDFAAGLSLKRLCVAPSWCYVISPEPARNGREHSGAERV
jgi:hypothetical protein